MRRLVLGVAFACLLGLLACGPVRPELHIRRGGWWADAYGFACECGSQTFDVIGRTLTLVRLRCPDCHREWVTEVPRG